MRSVYGGSNVSAFSATDLATTVMFTDDPLVPGTTLVRAVHLTELRTAVNAVRFAAGLAAVTFTDPVSTSLPIRAQHIIELRGAINTALPVLGASAIAGASAIVSGGSIPVRAVEFQAIRNVAR